MCGIFGFAKREGWQSDSQMNRIKDVFTNLTDESVIRGQDSTGISIMSGEGSSLYKTLKSSDDLILDDSWEEIMGSVDKDTTVAMGHVRFATHGTVSIRNAHPFSIGKVIGAHNGVIMNHDIVAKKINKSVEVDSEVIFGLINKKDDIQDVLDLIYGDYAISWVKENSYILNLLHEKGRPLVVAYWKKARCLFWASTHQIMGYALQYAGLQIDIAKVPTDKVYSFDTREFWSSPNPNITEVQTNVSGYWAYNNKQNYTGYGSSHSHARAKCVYCYKDTWSIDKICTNCCGERTNGIVLDRDGEWGGSCSKCSDWRRYDELVLIEDTRYECFDCIEDVQIPKTSSDENGVSCDFCGDWLEKNEIVVFNGYDICSYCDKTERDWTTHNQSLMTV
jgi:glucosamine 6-phosphate synthetase-like amidotransferase/phosphosugar isomerase protein|tara:strand:- start:4241 stop:5416 length:1176 start_codon:yes stop_codon:yes gene_type:complete